MWLWYFLIILSFFLSYAIFTRIQIQLEQSDSGKGPSIMPCSEKGISVLATNLIIVHRTKLIFRH